MSVALLKVDYGRTFDYPSKIVLVKNARIFIGLIGKEGIALCSSFHYCNMNTIYQIEQRDVRHILLRIWYAGQGWVAKWMP